jgi:type II secretory pathway pseudopilin PulG
LKASERGFSVPELLVAIVLLLLIGFATLGVLQGFSRALADRSTAESGSIALDRELDAMKADAASSYAVFVPLRDVFGKTNAMGADTATPGVGHEVDFYTKNDHNVESYWAYDYDATAKTLQRYDYVPSAAGAPAIGVFDRTTGALNTAAHYPTISNVQSFETQTLFASQLGSTKNAFGALVQNLVAQVGATPAADPVGFVPTSGKPQSDLYGGNTTVQLQVQTNAGTRIVHLASAVMPSGFTIHEYPAIRGVVYRLDQVHRSWFGLAQITHSGIYEQLLVSYTPKDPTSWSPWCDYEVYGSGSSGLRLNDPKTQYDPTDYHETMGGIYNAVADGSANSLNPVQQCGSTVPGPNATYAPIVPAPPIVVPTNPPCFIAGQCWPDQAPPNWIPASPWPVQSPPASWCATHAASPLCGGTGGTPEPATGALPPITYETPEPASTPPG